MIAQKGPGAPNTDFHDSPGFLDQATSIKLTDKAKHDTIRLSKS